jgi:hypothetical protein
LQPRDRRCLSNAESGGVLRRWCATFGEAEETPSGGTGRRC